MILYYTRARVKKEISSLRTEINHGKISKIRPFGIHFIKMVWLVVASLTTNSSKREKKEL
jgi:hypothetical protein